ncbi:SpoIIE family protein phosphatase [Bacillus alkalicellulosilyticus]|uniref:SpoIIE family protein phosphatase n=1 Tax=Alkalihalobacterium alkalicellulosilyticum TaxID=1912214 RepID=UPI000997CD08|nr:SpoIIE family protein phosphatase [Bacillus alkalicellulosilyticus]
MNELLNHMPCGFLVFSKEGSILSINETLLRYLEYNREELIDKPINTILSKSARAFFQLYFIPLVTVEKKVEEMYISLESKNGLEIPVLLNASYKDETTSITCIVVHMKKRNEYEDQLLIARKMAEDALSEKNKAHAELEEALEELKAQQEELIEVNRQNQQFILETEAELNLAKKIQETSLSEDICNKEIEIVSYYNASSELSGDIFGFYQINEDQYGVIILDVMGHGASSALITMSLHSLFHRLITRGFATDIVMKELDKHLHQLFDASEEAWHYCTAIYLFIDTKKQTIEYINAGHPPAIYQDEKGQQKELYTLTPPIGTIEGIHFQTRTISYTKGAKLLLYTDGVNEFLETDHLSLLLKKNTSSSLETIKKSILHSIELKKSSVYKSDDQCFVLIDLK